MPDIIPPKLRAKSRLLAERGRNVIVRAAVLGLALPSRDQHFGRTGLGGIGVEAFALLVALALAELSAPDLQSGVPLAPTGQITRPDTIEPGLASRDSASPASLARALRSSMVSPGVFSGGKIDSDFSNSLPISLMRPGLSDGEGDGCAAGGFGGGGVPCRAGCS